MKQVIELKRKTYEQLQQTVTELTLKNCLLEKTLDKACEYIFDDALNGCPYNYDYKTIPNEKDFGCYACEYQFIGMDESKNNSKYKSKGCICWRKIFIRSKDDE